MSGNRSCYTRKRSGGVRARNNGRPRSHFLSFLLDGNEVRHGHWYVLISWSRCDVYVMSSRAKR